MDDFESHRPPIDTLSFLDDLDQGLDLAPPHGVPRVDVSAVGAAADAALAVGAPRFPADRAMPRPRPLLDLFPPPAAIGPAGVPAPPPATLANRAPDVDPRPAPPSTGRALGAYETFYGLRERPFAPEPDAKFFYHSVEHDRASQDLYESIFRRDGLAILTGDAGTGKTILCRALVDRIDRRTFTSFVADPWVTLEDLLKVILVDFGVISRTDLAGPRLAEATRHQLTAALYEFLLSLVQISGFALVFIDDAQTLSAEMLAQVQEVVDTDQALMGIVLIGQPELLLKIGRRQTSSGADRVPVRARLDPLADDEIAGYVLHRLAISGAGRLSIEFEDAALALIYEISRGVPQIVNLLCDRALTRGFEASVTIIGEPLVASAARDLDLIVSEPVAKRTMRKVGAAAALLGLVLLGVAAGAFVFRAQLTRTIAAWGSPPAVPPEPAFRAPPPVLPAPPSADESANSRGRR
ncbi:MAG: AAA family ATPase [Acidobacteriota bacterium]